MTSCLYRKSHCGDKTVVRSSYLHNGISYAGKMSSIYWITPRSFNCIPLSPDLSEYIRLYCKGTLGYFPINELAYNYAPHCCRSFLCPSVSNFHQQSSSFHQVPWTLDPPKQFHFVATPACTLIQPKYKKKYHQGSVWLEPFDVKEGCASMF